MESRMTVDENGTKMWENEEGQLHREDGPAVIRFDGTEEWYLNGARHRDNGPAVIWPNGTKIWYKNGFAHREDGPAVIWDDSTVEWWLNDENYSFGEWADELNLDQKAKLEMVMRWNLD